MLRHLKDVLTTLPSSAVGQTVVRAGRKLTANPFSTLHPVTTGHMVLSSFLIFQMQNIDYQGAQKRGTFHKITTEILLES